MSENGTPGFHPTMYMGAMAIPRITGSTPSAPTAGVTDVQTADAPKDTAPVVPPPAPTAAGKVPQGVDARLGGTDKKLRDTLVALKQSTREGLPAALQQAIHQLATSPRQDVVEALRAIQLVMATSADLVAAVVQVMPNDSLVLRSLT